MDHGPARAGYSARLALESRIMNQNPPASSSAVVDAPVVQPALRQPVDSRALAAALAGIGSDSQRDPEIYLHDTVVPHGGE